MKELEKTYRGLIDWMVKHPQEVLTSRKHLQEKLIKKRFIYGDAAMQTTLMPVFLKRKSLEKIRSTSLVLDRVIDKVIDLYFEDEYVREYFPNHYEIPREWVHAPTGYTKPTVLNRLDVLFDGKNLKYIEFNTDNPGGKGWVDMLEHLYLNHPMYHELIDFSDARPRSIVAAQFDAVMRCCQEFGIDHPRVALVGFSGLGSRGDEEIVRDYFIERGVETNLLDPRDFEWRDAGLYSNGVRFDTLIRCMTSRFFLRYPREMRDFVQAITRRGVCLVNSFRSILGSEKSILSFLTNPLNHRYFTEEEVRVIKDHVPWSRRFDETVTLSKDGEEISIKAYMIRHREDLVIKPSSGAGGYGVMVGRTTDPLKWNEAIEDNIGSPGWIVQEYVEIPRLKLPVIKKNKVMIEEKFLNFSPYVFGGHYAGILGRVSDNSVINVSSGGGMIPVFPLKEDAVISSRDTRFRARKEITLDLPEEKDTTLEEMTQAVEG
jgi:glutathionylspermidine synthase